MKRIGKAWFLGVVAAGCMAGVASANQIQSVNGAVPYTWQFLGTDGLPLGGYVEGTTKFDNRFESMCLEPKETFNPGGTYFWTQSMAADNGGTVSGTDPIRVGTAYLYNRYAQGLLEPFGAAAVQNAIWYLEEGGDLTVGNSLITWLGTQGLGNVLAVASYNQYGVSVLNLWGDANYSRHAQDQLYYDGSNRVPDGGMTLAMLGTALAGLAALRRRR
jgi:hypothetical protein